MKKNILFIMMLMCLQTTAHAVDLIEVYQQALTSDPTYLQAISQRLATREGVPISISQLLPNISFTANPSLTRTAYAGADVTGTSALNPRNNTGRDYTMALTLTQTVFNYTDFANVAGSLATAKGADATLNAALQSLMIRVSSAYFAVLKDEDNLSYNEASKIAYEEQLDQVKQQFQVGLKTITDVYTAEASYDSAVALYIAAQTTLANDRENLRVITGKYYPVLASLSENFPLISPRPANVEKWVTTALQQNWSVKSSQYSVETARQTVHQQFGGHLPTVSVQGTLDRIYSMNINGYSNVNQRNGPSTQTDRSIQLNITMPIFEGGNVVAQTNQAAYNFKVAQQSLELTTRNTINTTRQSYLGVISGISQIAADKQAIKSSISSLEGMEESYKVGTETLVDVLNQQQKVFEAQTQYATDRYAYVNNLLALKQAAGTLSFDDLRAINAWLFHKPRPTISGKRSTNYHKHTSVQHPKRKSV
ncbi:MAG: hypothetical protein ACD_46C00159G0005 [uncultured bacterium]|nr:MAG: hypothetical protein ACD_46C00159G0005 [uncultured bacterium]